MPERGPWRWKLRGGRYCREWPTANDPREGTAAERRFWRTARREDRLLRRGERAEARRARDAVDLAEALAENKSTDGA